MTALVPVRSLTTACVAGWGMAVCSALDVLAVTSSRDNTLTVYGLPRSLPSRAAPQSTTGLPRLCTLGGPDSPPELRFRFGGSGGLAFTDPTCTTAPLLLVTDDRNEVRVIDVASRVHVGYVGARGSIPGPRGVAARGSLVAVSCWVLRDCGVHVVRVFEGSGSDWTPLRVLGGGVGADGWLHGPFGLRFTGDGSGVAVADPGNHRVSLFSVGDGSFVRQLATGLARAYDVEECEGGWLVACYGSDTVEFVGGDGVGHATLGKRGSGDGEFDRPTALAQVPGLGWWCWSSAATGACRCSPPPTPSPWLACRMLGWRGWASWRGGSASPQPRASPRPISRCLATQTDPPWRPPVASEPGPVVRVRVDWLYLLPFDSGNSTPALLVAASSPSTREYSQPCTSSFPSLALTPTHPLSSFCSRSPGLLLVVPLWSTMSCPYGPSRTTLTHHPFLLPLSVAAFVVSVSAIVFLMVLFECTVADGCGAS